MKRIVLAAAFLGLASLTFGQEAPKPNFKLTGEFRTLGEYRDGYAAPLKTDVDVPGTVIRSRTRFTADYKLDKLTTKITF